MVSAMPEPAFAPLVTISATYGTGGSVIAPRLAERLGLPFIDRLISADMSQDAARAERDAGAARSEEGLCAGEQAATPAGRFLSYFARAASVGPMIAPEAALDDDDSIKERTEEGLHAVESGAPAVVLGRAGAVLLAKRPRAYHVRLDGATERRVAWAATHEHIDLDAARRRQSETDRARTLFVKRLFRVDPADPRLYHLVFDPTVIGVDAAVALLAGAAEAFFAANP
jgi:cytidylate kinase